MKYDDDTREFIASLRKQPNDTFHLSPSKIAFVGMLIDMNNVAFVLDYQDPWVGEWGRSVGPGENGRPDYRSRASRLIAARKVGASDGLVDETFEQIGHHIKADGVGDAKGLCENCALGCQSIHVRRIGRIDLIRVGVPSIVMVIKDGRIVYRTS
jgi:hypothetical protein